MVDVLATTNTISIMEMENHKKHRSRLRGGYPYYLGQLSYDEK
jgi:hypothetical protein